MAPYYTSIYLNSFGLLGRNASDYVVCTEKKIIAHSAEKSKIKAEKSKIKARASLVSCVLFSVS